MPSRPLIRAGVVAVSAAGVLAGAVTYRSEEKVEEAFGAAIEGKPIGEVERLFEDSRPLNPGAAREVALARANLEAGRVARAERLLDDAAELEPESLRLWYLRTRLALRRGRRAEAERHWARARALDPLLPAALPPPL